MNNTKPTYDELIEKLKEQEKEIKELKSHNFDENATLFQTLFTDNYSINLLIEVETGKIIDANKAACNFYGYTHNQFIEMNINQINILPESEIKKEMNDAIKGINNFFSFKHQLKNGEIKDVDVYSGKIILQNKELFYSTIHDVTRQKQNELELNIAKQKAEANETRLNFALKASKSGTWDWDMLANVFYFSDEIRAIFEMPIDTVPGFEALSKIIHPDDMEEVFKKINESTTNQTDLFYDYRIVLPNNKIHWIRTIGKTYYDKDEPIRRSGLCIDITEYKNAEETLQASETRYRTLFEKAMDGILILDENGNFVAVNQSYAEMHGFSIDQLLSKNLRDFDTPETQKLIPERIQRLKKGESLRFEAEHFHKDGHIIIVDVATCMFKIDNSSFFVAFHQDITEKKRIEHQVQHQYITAIIKGEESERSRLAQELHDGLGPLMTTLKLYMQTMQRINDHAGLQTIAQKAEKVFDETLQTITEVSNNISPHILRNFGLFSGLKSFIEKNISFQHINFHFDCKFTERIDELYEITLYRVMIELINNSIKHSDANQIELKLFKRGQYLFIKYRDNGKGFDIESVLITKKGMGLFNIQNRIHNIDGKITFGKYQKAGFVSKIIVKLPTFDHKKL